MNTEKEIVPENVPEANLNQPITSYAKIPFLRQVNTISQIYKWNPTGFRIVLNLPIISDDASPLFYLRAYPFIPHLGENVYHFGYSESTILFNQFRPIVHPLKYTSAGEWAGDIPIGDGNVPPVEFVHYNLPPLISILCQGNRRWRGDLHYRFRMASNFGNQGILCAAPLFGIKHGLQAGNFFKYATPMAPYDTGYLTDFANSYTYQDASMFRHLEVAIPWQKPYEWEDHYANVNGTLRSAEAYDGSSGNNNGGLGLDPSPMVFDFIAMFLRGNLPATSTTNSIIIEVDIKAGENFEFSGECIYPAPYPQMFLDYEKQEFNSGGVLSAILGHYSVPTNSYTTDGIGPVRPG